MRNQRIHLRASEADSKNIEIASVNLQQQTGRKADASKTIRAAVQQLAENKPDLFFINRPAIRDLDRNIEAGQIMLQEIADYFRANDIDIKIEEIHFWYGYSRSNFMVENQEAIRETVISKLFEKQKNKYPGLQFTRDNVTVPDLDGLYEAAGKLISVPEVANREVGIYWNCYSINENKVIVLPRMVEKVKNQFRCYASTPDEKQKLSQVRTLCRALDSFVAEKNIPLENISLKGICFYDKESARFEVHEQYILHGLTPTFIFKP